MDITRALLLQSGYKRTTIDEIARKADIGKGTVYLSWDTKDDLIRSLVIHDIIDVCDDMSNWAGTESDAPTLPSLSRRMFTLIFKYPLFRALYTRDRYILGRTCDDPSLNFQSYRITTFTPFRKYLGMLADNRALDGTTGRDSQYFSLDALMWGFIKLHLLSSTEASINDSAANLAELVRRSFGPWRTPAAATLKTISRKTAEIFKAAADEYRAMLGVPFFGTRTATASA